MARFFRERSCSGWTLQSGYGKDPSVPDRIHASGLSGTELMFFAVTPLTHTRAPPPIMTCRQIGLSVLTCGIALIFLGLYTNARVLWPFGSGLGVLLLFGGLLTFLFTLRGERMTAPHWLAIVLAVLALGLHVYENAFMRTGAFSIGFLLWSLMPYGLCLVASSFSGTRIAAIAGAFVALSFDLMVHYAVFMNPREFNVASAFLLIFAPLCNTLIFCPLAIVIA